MKKKLFNKLKLKKSAIATLQVDNIIGGNNSNGFDVYCESVNFCETKDFTRCFGEANCQIYQPHRG